MKALLLSFALYCAGNVHAQYHPYGDRDGPPPWPDSFGEKLHYLCSGRTMPDMKERAMLESLLPEFEENSDAVFTMLEWAPRDQYLSKLLGAIRGSDLDEDKKQKTYKAAYQRCLSEGEWPLALQTLLYIPDLLTKEEIRSHLSSKDEYVRRVAERALQRLAIRERQNPPGGHDDGTRTGRGDRPADPLPVSADFHGKTGIRAGLAAGISAIAAALGWWFWRRYARPTEP